MKRLPSLWLFDWRKVLVYTHRWLGIAGCLLFIAWFISGVVMMYARMPGLANEERLARAPALDLSAVTLSPAEAADQFKIKANRLVVGMHGSRPVYRYSLGQQRTMVFADTGTRFEGLSRDEAAQVASRYAPHHSGAVTYDRYITAPDQWTLQARALMPMHRFALGDAAATYLYVSNVTGDVVLRTTGRERFWGYLGPVIHWLYFTPLRQNGPLWSEVVIWASLVGCVMCLFGLLWGLWRFSPASRFRLKRVPSHTPYAGWMKWHHYAGLIFGVITLTWTYSGLLSMGPFNWFEEPPMRPAVFEALTGGRVNLAPLTIAGMRAAATAVESAFPVKELEAMEVRGEAFWSAYRAPSAEQAVQWMHVGLLPRAPLPRLDRLYISAAHPERSVFTTFDDEAMIDVAHAAMPDVPIQDSTWLREYDGYYYDPRGSEPLPVLRVRYADEHQTWLYLDPSRGGIVLQSVKISRLRRWLYQGLHSLDFPFLYFRRPLWDIVAIVLSIGGTALSITTVLPALRRIRRIVRAFRRTVASWSGRDSASVGSSANATGFHERRKSTLTPHNAQAAPDPAILDVRDCSPQKTPHGPGSSLAKRGV